MLNRGSFVSILIIKKHDLRILQPWRVNMHPSSCSCTDGYMMLESTWHLVGSPEIWQKVWAKLRAWTRLSEVQLKEPWASLYRKLCFQLSVDWEGRTVSALLSSSMVLARGPRKRLQDKAKNTFWEWI